MIKTTKTDFKQKQVFHDTMDVEGKATFGGDVEVDGKVIVNRGSDIVDKDGNASVVTLDDEQHISGHKYFTKLSIADSNYKDKFDITTDISSTEKANIVTFARETVSEVHYAEDLYIFKNADDTYQFRISVQSNKAQLSIKGKGSAIVFDLPTKSGTLMTTDDVSALTETKLTLKSGNIYSTTARDIDWNYKYHLLIALENNGQMYTASFDISSSFLSTTAKVTGRVPFLMAYGSTSDDVATCFAYYDITSNSCLLIDLDNAQLTTGYKLRVFYSKYN